MSVFTLNQKGAERSKVHHSQYIRTENASDETDTKPVEPAKPTQPEAK